MQANPDAKLHRFSTTIEKERPELNQETKDLIAAYLRNPSDENRAALRRQVAKNYDAIVARKKAKLEELKRTARAIRSSLWTPMPRPREHAAAMTSGATAGR